MANCAYHPDREAVGSCVGCGRLVCAECKTVLRGKIYCNLCAEKMVLGRAETAVKAPEMKETITSPLGPRDIGGILGDTFTIYGRNCWRLWGVVAIVEVILGILSWVLLQPAITFVTEGEIESLAPFIIAVTILVVVSFVAYALLEGALIHAVSEQSLGQTISIGRAYRFAWRRLGAMIGAQILAGLALLGMTITIIGIPFAIYFAFRWTFIWQAALVEGVDSRAALSRSSDLVRGNWWRVLGIMLVVGIIVGMISSIVGLIPTIGQIIGAILSTPLAIIGATLLYYDLRVRKEGYSLETLAQELDMKISSDVA